MNCGVKLPLDTKIMSRKVRRGLRKGTYEIEEAEAARDLFLANDTVLELGAGIGFMSSYLRKYTGVGRIVAYEADARLIPCIERTHTLNDVTSIEVHNAVVTHSDGSGALPFYIRDEFWASSLSPNQKGVVNTTSVPTKNWAEVLADIRPTALVMDIEGGEVDLLENCDLGSIDRAVIELHPSRGGIIGMAKVYTAIVNQGFTLIRESADRSVISIRR
jgi:FkbM family methyltransferase